MSGSQSEVIAAAMELAAAYVAHNDTVRQAQERRAARYVGHADPAATQTIVAAMERLSGAEMAYREALTCRSPSRRRAHATGRTCARLNKPRVAPSFFREEAAAAFLAGYDAEMEVYASDQ